MTKWNEIKEKLVKEHGFIDNGEEVEKHFDGGFICFLSDGRVILNKKITMDEIASCSEGGSWPKQ